MLTDIFARRYANYPIWTEYTENEPRLLQQCIGVAKDVLPYYSSSGHADDAQQAKWKSIHDRLARELGVGELWRRYFTVTRTWQGVDSQMTHTNPWVTICEYFVTSGYVPQTHGTVDRYMKERLSLIELVMRERHNEINEMNRTIEQRIQTAKQPRHSGFRFPGDPAIGIRARDAAANDAFNASVNELNVRFLQAGVLLSYHNGFIQVAKDEQVEKQVAEPFWRTIAAPKWINVAIDMNEALDRRDSGAGDAAWYGCRALESAIKIISDQKGWSTGNEKGAHNYIDNLVAERDGARFIDTFEMHVLKAYFTHVRNQFGHGPGSKPMPNFTMEQTDWAIETAMTWIRSLVRR